MPVCRLPSGPKGQDSEFGERRRGGGGGEERRGHKRPRSQLSGGPGGGGGGWSPPGGAHGGAQAWAPGLYSTGGPPSINIPSSGAAYGYSSPRPNPRYTQVRMRNYSQSWIWKSPSKCTSPPVALSENMWGPLGWSHRPQAAQISAVLHLCWIALL